jgi:hypothetical protein
MGRLKAAAPRKGLRGHAVRARAGVRVLDSSRTDGAGRFLLRWVAGAAEAEKTAIELLSARGAVVESVELAAADLVSPSVVGFSGKEVAVAGPGGAEELGTGSGIDADGDHPICVTSSCIEVTLSWTVPAGARASLLSGSEVVCDGLVAGGSLKVVEASTRRYTLRTWPPGAGLEDFSDREVEVRRYPSLSLVMEGSRFRRGTLVDLGASISCPAGDGGVKVTVLTSDAGLVPETVLTIPAGSRWASARARLGEMPGTAKVTATASGFVRDGVTFVVE